MLALNDHRLTVHAARDCRQHGKGIPQMREGSAVSVACRSALRVHSGLVLSTIFPYATITTPTPVKTRSATGTHVPEGSPDDKNRRGHESVGREADDVGAAFGEEVRAGGVRR